MKIELGSKELNITSASIIRSMDTVGAEWSCVIPEVDQNLDQELYNLIKPRSFASAIASIDGQKLCVGNKYITSPTVTATGSGVELRGFSKTFRLSASHPKEQKEFSNLSLAEIGNALARPFGLVVKFDSSLSAEVNEKFANEKIGAQTPVYSFLQNLARQRGLLMSDDIFGNIQFLRTSATQKPVGSIVEGEDAIFPSAEQFRAVFDDTQIKQNYYSVNNNNLAFLSSKPTGVAKNSGVKIPSFKAIQLDSLVVGAGQKAVDFARNYDLAASIQMPMQVNGWHASDGNLWRENTFVSVVSKSLFIPDGFTFLIRRVQYNLDSQGGRRTILSFIPPELYAGGEIKEPW